MALRVATAEGFPHKEVFQFDASGGEQVRKFEFERTTFLTGFAVSSTTTTNHPTVKLDLSFPSTFSENDDPTYVRLFDGQIGETTGLYMAPGTISTAGNGGTAANGPLPSTFPRGSVLTVTVTPNSDAGTVNAFLITAGGHDSY